ncbi:acetyl-coenzyme A synthetase 2 [Sarracenia purpurea var. burkii]
MARGRSHPTSGRGRGRGQGRGRGRGSAEAYGFAAKRWACVVVGACVTILQRFNAHMWFLFAFEVHSLILIFCYGSLDLAEVYWSSFCPYQLSIGAVHMLSFELIEEWVEKNPEASICSSEGVKALQQPLQQSFAT